MKYKGLIIGSIIGVAGLALYFYLRRQIDLFKDFEIKIAGFRLHAINAAKVAFTLTARFTNKSNIEGVINDVSSDVYVEGRKMGVILEDKKVVIPAKGFNDIDLYFEFDTKTLVGGSLGIILNLASHKTVTLSLRGQASVSSGFISRKIPIEYDTTVSI